MTFSGESVSGSSYGISTLSTMSNGASCQEDQVLRDKQELSGPQTLAPISRAAQLQMHSIEFVNPCIPVAAQNIWSLYPYTDYRLMLRKKK